MITKNEMRGFSSSLKIYEAAKCVRLCCVCMVCLSGELSQTLLQREWLDSKGQKEKGAQFNDMIQTLLK
jgi:hypothetical protein